MNVFLLILAIAIAVPSACQWFRVYKSADFLAIKPFESYWENVWASAPLSFAAMAFIIGGGAFHPDQSTLRLFGIALLSLLFFPVSLLYFHSIMWLSNKVWTGLGFTIHLMLIGTTVYFTNGNDLVNSIEIVVFLVVFVMVTTIIVWIYSRINGLFS